MNEFKPGQISVEEASELNRMRRLLTRISKLRIAAPLRLRDDPAGWCIEQILPPANEPSVDEGPYPYSGYGTIEFDSIVVPVYRYRCNGSHLEEQTIYHQILAPHISQILFDHDPNADGNDESKWWCVGGDCVNSTQAPEGYNSGPYSTQTQCAQNCI